MWRLIMSTIKIRAKESNGVVTVKALMKHPMEPVKEKIKKQEIIYQRISFKRYLEKQMVAKSLLFTGVPQSRKIPT